MADGGGTLTDTQLASIGLPPFEPQAGPVRLGLCGLFKLLLLVPRS